MVEIHVQGKVPRCLPASPTHTENSLDAGDILQDGVWRLSEACILIHSPAAHLPRILELGGWTKPRKEMERFFLGEIKSPIEKTYKP